MFFNQKINIAAIYIKKREPFIQRDNYFNIFLEIKTKLTDNQQYIFSKKYLKRIEYITYSTNRTLAFGK